MKSLFPRINYESHHSKLWGQDATKKIDDFLTQFIFFCSNRILGLGNFKRTDLYFIVLEAVESKVRIYV